MYIKTIQPNSRSEILKKKSQSINSINLVRGGLRALIKYYFPFAY